MWLLFWEAFRDHSYIIIIWFILHPKKRLFISWVIPYKLEFYYQNTIYLSVHKMKHPKKLRPSCVRLCRKKERFIFGGHLYDAFIVDFTIIARIILTEATNICHLIFRCRALWKFFWLFFYFYSFQITTEMLMVSALDFNRFRNSIAVFFVCSPSYSISESIIYLHWVWKNSKRIDGWPNFGWSERFLSLNFFKRKYFEINF